MGNESNYGIGEELPTTQAPRSRRPPRTAFGRALQVRSARRLRARRVRRLVRHVEPWSVLKVSLIFYFCAWVIMLFVGVTLWNLAVNSGLVDNVENFVVELFALESFTINADQIFRIAALGGLVLVVAGSGFTVLAAVLFNLISDVTGGIRLTVVEEETARPRPRRARRRVLVAAPPVAAPSDVAVPVAASPVMGTPVVTSPVMGTPAVSPVTGARVAASPVMGTPVIASPVMETRVAASPDLGTPVATSPVTASQDVAPYTSDASDESG